MVATTTFKNRGWVMKGGYLDRQNGRHVLCIRAYLLRTPLHSIQVDSCDGNHKPRPTHPFWNNDEHRDSRGTLARAGVSLDRMEHQVGEWSQVPPHF
jgi:hypothetical protein